jgi:hypothetical protein
VYISEKTPSSGGGLLTDVILRDNRNKGARKCKRILKERKKEERSRESLS